MTIVLSLNQTLIAQDTLRVDNMDGCGRIQRIAEVLPKYPSGDEGAIADVKSVVSQVACGLPSQTHIFVVIATDGSMIDPVLMPDEFTGCSPALEEAFKSLPRWTPGTQAGVPVCVQIVFPLK